MRSALLPMFHEIENIFTHCDEDCSISEDQEKIYVEAAVPGLKGEDLQITFEKGVLSIKGEKKVEKKDVTFHNKAKSCFSYQVSISAKLDENTPPEAVCKDGIVCVTFTKSKMTKPQIIAVKNQ